MSEHPPTVPRAALLGAALLLGLALLLAALGRGTGVGTTVNPTSVAVEQTPLRFEDLPDGAVAVRARAGEAPLAVLEPGSHGFLRSVVRGLVRERRLRDIGSEPAFQLVRWADGRLTLDDPATGRSVELGVFGPANAEVFARLLIAARSAS